MFIGWRFDVPCSSWRVWFAGPCSALLLPERRTDDEHWTVDQSGHNCTGSGTVVHQHLQQWQDKGLISFTVGTYCLWASNIFTQIRKFSIEHLQFDFFQFGSSLTNFFYPGHPSKVSDLDLLVPRKTQLFRLDDTRTVPSRHTVFLVYYIKARKCS